MKITILLIISIFHFNFVEKMGAQVEPTLILVTTIDPKESTSIVLDAEGNVELYYSKDNYIHVTIKVESNGFSRQQMKALLPGGIFKIEPITDAEQLRLTMPGLKMDVTVNGKKLVEKVSFLITIPTNMSFRHKIKDVTTHQKINKQSPP